MLLLCDRPIGHVTCLARQSLRTSVCFSLVQRQKNNKHAKALTIGANIARGSTKTNRYIFVYHLFVQKIKNQGHRTTAYISALSSDIFAFYFFAF